MDSQLEKAIDKRIIGRKHVLTIYESESGEIQFSGDHKWMEALVVNRPDLKVELDNTLRGNMVEEEEELRKEMCPLQYKKLKFDISKSNKFNKDMGRKTLCDMLSVQGFGKGGPKKNGVGLPPMGWVEEFDWPGYRGPSNTNGWRHTHTIRLITSMLIYAGYDPNTHITDEVAAGKAAKINNQGNGDQNGVELAPEENMVEETDRDLVEEIEDEIMNEPIQAT